MIRRGISLLEVLFAMLIGTIGLLGAISLLPVAIEQANKGREADAQMVFGESAVEEFKVRSHYLPDLWVVYDGNDGIQFDNFNGKYWRYFDSANAEIIYVPNGSGGGQWQKASDTSPMPMAESHATVPPGPNASFCFDPLGVANYLPGTPAYASFPYGRALVSQFPSNGPGMPVMYRAGMTQIFNNSGSLSVLPASGAFSFRSVTPQFAETACFSHDEVRLFRPKPVTDPATLTYETDTSKPLNMRPQVEPLQQYSWFATMSPKSDGHSDEYLLSIVVCHRRPLPPTTPDALSERVAGIVLYDGVTGGDAVLNGATSDDVNVQAGDWILLVGTYNTTAGTGATASDSQARFTWYRVIQAEAEATYTATPSPNYARNITLFGPDWDIPSGANPMVAPRTYAVLVTGVKAVYERTIRVQRSSLWY